MSNSDTNFLKMLIGSRKIKLINSVVIIFSIVFLESFSAFCQTNNVGIGCTNPDPSAILELRTTPPLNMGFLVPRMTQANRPATPVLGLLIYQTDMNPGFYYWDGVAWVSIGNGTGTTGQVAFWGANNNLLGSNNLFWDNTTSRLGIGISPPTQSLEIYNGNLLLSNNGLAGELMLQMPAGAFYTTFKAQAQVTNINYSLPTTVGTVGQVLSTDGTGILNWVNSVPAGTSGYTLRYDATNTLISNFNIFNDGTNVGIGFAAVPALTQRLEVNGNLLLTNAGTAAELMLATPGGANFTSFKSQAQLANVTYTLPPADGTTGQALVTNGTGSLSWASISGSLPAGTSGQTLRYDATNTLISTSALLNDGTNISIPNELRFVEPSPPGTFYTSFKAQTQTANINYTLPAAIGTAGQALVTDATGVLSWATVSGSLPVGTSGQTLRYDATNALVANSLLFNNGTNIGIGTVSPISLLHISDNNNVNQVAPLAIHQGGKVMLQCNIILHQVLNLQQPV